MKPLHKVVTASDVQSCLYYVHVDSAEDDKIRDALQQEQNQIDGYGGTGRRTQPRDANWVQRKPLRNEPDLALDESPALPPRLSSHLQSPTQSPNGSMQIGRKPIGRDPRAAGSGRADPASAPAASHLLGPRPMHPRLRSIDSAALGNRPERRNDDPRRRSENQAEPPKLPNSSSWGVEQNPPCSPTRPNVGPEEAGSLTLIRRYDDLQWNVGKISRMSGTTSSTDFRNINQGFPFGEVQGADIAIFTPGYAKFTGREVLNDSPSRSALAKLQDRPSCNEEQVSFTRQLRAVNYMKSLDQRRKSGFSDSTLSKQGPKSKFRFHKHSREYTCDESNGSNFPPASPTHQTVDSKGYTFQSPWDGTCEFHAGVAGRSLKCKHTVSQAHGRSAPVSELRFNLPSSKSIGGASPKGNSLQGYSAVSKWSSALSTRSNQLSSSGSVDDQTHDDYTSSDDKLDLSLGQENAGGGFGGKQAKLGKLIIENEGLKMLDLVVAANVGIWWRVYEKYV